MNSDETLCTQMSLLPANTVPAGSTRLLSHCVRMRHTVYACDMSSCSVPWLRLTVKPDPLPGTASRQARSLDPPDQDAGL